MTRANELQPFQLQEKPFQLRDSRRGKMRIRDSACARSERKTKVKSARGSAQVELAEESR